MASRKSDRFFSRRAEMYYKKWMELMKLVEEFYQAYRALPKDRVMQQGSFNMPNEPWQQHSPTRFLSNWLKIQHQDLQIMVQSLALLKCHTHFVRCSTQINCIKNFGLSVNRNGSFTGESDSGLARRD